MRFLTFAASLSIGLALPAPARAQASNEELAKQLSNPVSSLMTVPFQMNMDCCFGPDDGHKYTLNTQPVIPFSLGSHANLIVRTIVPLTYEESTAPNIDDVSGVGDVTQSFFFTPKKSGRGPLIGLGPAFLWPIGRDVGAHKWAAGPTIVVVEQKKRITYGLLANHLWSYAGDSDRDSVIQSFLQPFFSYTYPDTTTLNLNAEASYDWKHDAALVPINASISHLYKVGEQRVQLAGGVRAYVDPPAGGPDWGLRFTTTLLFPTH